MYRLQIPRYIKTLLASSILLPLIALGLGPGPSYAANDTPGAVYVLTNATAGNSVAIFDRSADGTLAPAGTVGTGGSGTGAGLGSQGSLVLSANNRWLFAVNAGSNSISSFVVQRGGLELVSTVPLGGVRPISLTAHNRLLYVLNAGGSGNITGFNISTDGSLDQIAGSTRPLSGNNTGPAQLEFSPDGDLLVVTEKATNAIDIYAVGSDGLAAGPATFASSGATPFGFAFGQRNQLFVSEAFGGMPNQSAVSSYVAAPDGSLSVVSGSAATHQTAACWVVVTKNGRYTYTSNAGSGSITGYSAAPDGSLSLLTADGRTGVTGSGSSPTDMALSLNSRYLYVLESGAPGGHPEISAFQVRADGSLAPVAGATGLPAGAVGIAAR